VQSPKKAVVATDMGAMEQLCLWEMYQDHWCEHKPSMTCYYRDDEFLQVGQWLYNKFDKVSGISFLGVSKDYRVGHRGRVRHDRRVTTVGLCWQQL
jgi:hypothetical protein